MARLAAEKAGYAAEAVGGRSLYISADTAVVIRGRILGKPESTEKALEYLNLLNGKIHTVLTGFCVLERETGEKIQEVVETKVSFYRLEPDLLEKYAVTGESLDKAGGYAIQSMGLFMLKRLEGSYTNVVGFPLETFIHLMLKKKWLV